MAWPVGRTHCSVALKPSPVTRPVVLTRARASASGGKPISAASCADRSAIAVCSTSTASSPSTPFPSATMPRIRSTAARRPAGASIGQRSTRMARSPAIRRSSVPAVLGTKAKAVVTPIPRARCEDGNPSGATVPRPGLARHQRYARGRDRKGVLGRAGVPAEENQARRI